jgi:hypothetical protein
MQNLIGGVYCPPVVCQRRGFYFMWWNGHRWQQENELPQAIIDKLPQSERDRVADHALERSLER